MSLFQCTECGCVENTALCNHAWNKGKLKIEQDYCSACDPQIKKWHGRFHRTFLEKGKWKTNREGNLEHIETGETDFHKYAIDS
jgi:hypothetical protein